MVLNFYVCPVECFCQPGFYFESRNQNYSILSLMPAIAIWYSDSGSICAISRR